MIYKSKHTLTGCPQKGQKWQFLSGGKLMIVYR